MRDYRYNAARGSVGVACKSSGLVEASYSGPLSTKAFDCLRDEMIPAVIKASCAVIRMDRALLLSDALPVVGAHHVKVPPAVLIVRRDQYRVFEDYARAMSKAGIIRLVYCDDVAHLGYAMALALCRARRDQ